MPTRGSLANQLADAGLVPRHVLAVYESARDEQALGQAIEIALVLHSRLTVGVPIRPPGFMVHYAQCSVEDLRNEALLEAGELRRHVLGVIPESLPVTTRLLRAEHKADLAEEFRERSIDLIVRGPGLHGVGLFSRRW